MSFERGSGYPQGTSKSNITITAMNSVIFNQYDIYKKKSSSAEDNFTNRIYKQQCSSMVSQIRLWFLLFPYSQTLDSFHI